MLEFIDSKTADFVIIIKDTIPLFGNQSFSLSLIYKNSISDIISRLMALQCIESVCGNRKPYRYQLTIIPKNSQSVSKTFRFNTNFSKDELQSELISVFKNELIPKQKKATHYIQVFNMDSKERDNRLLSVCYDSDTKSLRDKFKQYCQEELKNKLEDNIIFCGEQQRNSHRVIVYVSTNRMFDKQKDIYKSKSFSINFPHYSSDEIIEYFKCIDKESVCNDEEK